MKFDLNEEYLQSLSRKDLKEYMKLIYNEQMNELIRINNSASNEIEELLDRLKVSKLLLKQTENSQLFLNAVRWIKIIASSVMAIVVILLSGPVGVPISILISVVICKLVEKFYKKTINHAYKMLDYQKKIQTLIDEILKEVEDLKNIKSNSSVAIDEIKVTINEIEISTEVPFLGDENLIKVDDIINSKRLKLKND